MQGPILPNFTALVQPTMLSDCFGMTILALEHGIWDWKVGQVWVCTLPRRYTTLTEEKAKHVWTNPHSYIFICFPFQFSQHFLHQIQKINQLWLHTIVLFIRTGFFIGSVAQGQSIGPKYPFHIQGKKIKNRNGTFHLFDPVCISPV